MEVPNNLIGENNQNTNEAMNEQSSDNSMAETACDSANDIKLKVPLPVILFLGTIIIVSVISLIKFPGILKDYRTFKTAKERVEYGETSQVLNDLHILTEKYPESLPIIIRTIEQSLENGYYEYAAYVHDTYMVGKKLTNAEYQWVETYTSWLDKYFYTTDQVNAIINQALDYSDEETIRQEIIYNLIGLILIMRLSIIFWDYMSIIRNMQLIILWIATEMIQNAMMFVYSWVTDTGEPAIMRMLYYIYMRPWQKIKGTQGL